MVSSGPSTGVGGFGVRSRYVGLRVGLENFPRYYFSTACLYRLTTSVRVSRFRTILRSLALRRVRYFRRFTKDRAGLTNVPSKLLPLTTSQEDRFSAGASVELRVRLFYRTNGRFRFVRFLGSRRGTLARFLYRRDGLSVTFIFVSVASGGEIEVNVSNGCDVRFQFKANFGSRVGFLTITSCFFGGQTRLIRFGQVSSGVLNFVSVFFEYLFGAVNDLFGAIVRGVQGACRRQDHCVARLRLISRFFRVSNCTVFPQYGGGVALIVGAGM